MNTTNMGEDAADKAQDIQENPWLMLVTDLAENTGMHGLPNISRHRSFVKKAFWLLILLAATGVGLWQIGEAIAKFYRYPSETTMKVEVVNKLQFPAVTFCNINTMRYSFISSGEFSSYFNDFSQSATPAPPPASDSGNRTFQDWSAMESDPSFYALSADYAAEENFLVIYTSLSAYDRTYVGHQLQDMLISCSFAGSKCGTGNFSQSLNAQYGNCYTFNDGYDSELIQSVNKPGPRHALELVLYLQQNEYVKQVAQSAGVRVVIHNASEIAFPQDVGFSVRPGAETYVALKRVENYLTFPPYGPCFREADSVNQQKNGWAMLDPLRPIDYTSKACKYTCFQKHLMADCRCYDPFYPNNGSIFDNLGGSRLGVCNTTSTSPIVAECVANISSQFAEGKLGCEQECPPACSNVVHQREISQTDWPSTVYEADITDKVFNADEWAYESNSQESQTVQSQFIRDNVLKLRIFFADLDVTTVKTSPSYEITQLLSDLGGQTGLWLGFSVITVFEFVELFWGIAVLCTTQVTNKKKIQQLS